MPNLLRNVLAVVAGILLRGWRRRSVLACSDRTRPRNHEEGEEVHIRAEGRRRPVEIWLAVLFGLLFADYLTRGWAV